MYAHKQKDFNKMSKLSLKNMENRLVKFLLEPGIYENLGHDIFYRLDEISSDFSELKSNFGFVQGAIDCPSKTPIDEVAQFAFEKITELNLLHGYEITIPKYTPKYTANDFISWRESRGLSITNAAKLLGVSSHAVKSWETGKRKVSAPIAILCTAYELSAVRAG